MRTIDPAHHRHPPGALAPILRESEAVTTAALLILLLLPPRFAAAAGKPPGIGTTPPHGNGRLLILLGDGSLREPSTDRAESTDEPDVLESGEVDWEVSPVGASQDRLGSRGFHSLEVGHAEVRYGCGGGLEAGVRAESWNRVRVEEPLAGSGIEESGYGPTSVQIKQRLAGGGEERGTLAARAEWRFPGAPRGPGTRAVEGDLTLPFALDLGHGDRLGAMVESDWVADSGAPGRHLDSSVSLALTRDYDERRSGRIEVVSVWSGERTRAWLGVVDGGFSWEPVTHLALTAGVSAGVGGGVTDLGWFGRMSVRP